MRAVRVKLAGKVQRVGFRWFVLREAEAAGVAGWVRNSPDGTVDVEAQGEDGSVEHFVQSLRRGPAHADVRSADIADVPPIPSRRGFRIVS